MKVLLVGFFTRTYMPYIEKYEEILNKKNVEYEIVFFDRDSTKKSISQVGNEYYYSHKTTSSKLQKFLPVMRYALFVRKLLKENNYDKVILFTTMPAILCKSILEKRYIGNYIYDYRDTTYEHHEFFKKWVQQIIKNSYFTAVSSKGYVNVLGESDKYIFNHNISNLANAVDQANGFGEEITIGFLGYVRYPDVNQKLIDAFKDSEKYKLLYVGTQFSDCNLLDYANNIGACNVEVHGKFDNREKCRLYSKIDIINSMYSTNSNEVQFAIPNRLYDAAIFGIPLMTTKGTYLAELTEQYGLGFAINPFEDDIYQEIENYVNSFDVKMFECKCKEFLKEVQLEEDVLKRKIESFLDK